jgi:hypothetical protein
VVADVPATVEDTGPCFISEYVYYLGHAFSTIREYVVKAHGSLDVDEWSASPGNPSLVPIEWAPEPIWALQTEGKHRHISENRTTIFRSSSPFSSRYVDFAIPAVVFFRSAYSVVNKIITAASANNTVEMQRQRSKSAVKCHLFGT